MRVIVVGAGIAGLGAATLFARRGHTVEVFEAGDRVGGRALTVASKHGARLDAGTQYFHTNYRLARGLLRDLGLERQLTTVKGYTRFFDDRVRKGAFRVSHRLPWFPPAGIANIGALGPLMRAAFSRFNPYALDLRPRLDQAAAWDEICSPKLREFVLRPLVLAGALSEPEAAAPSLLHALRLLKIVVLTDYLVLPQGVASFHDALAARLSVRRGAKVGRLIVDKAAVTGVELDGTAELLRADHVVVATTPTEAAKLLPVDWVDERRFLNGIEIPPVVLPTFFLDRPLSPDIWSYMSQADRGRQVSFVIDAARKNPALAGSENGILQVWPCYPASKTLVHQSDTEVAETCRRELESHFPGFSSWIAEVRVARHPYAVPFNPVGHQQRAAEFLRCADNRKGVSFCGDYLTGGFMEAALWSAARAASRHA